MSVCRSESCKAPIIWGLSPAGRLIPLNTKPEKRAVVTEDRGGDLPPRVAMVDTYMPHHATCPQADAWRNTKTPKKGEADDDASEQGNHEGTAPAVVAPPEAAPTAERNVGHDASEAEPACGKETGANGVPVSPDFSGRDLRDVKIAPRLWERAR